MIVTTQFGTFPTATPGSLGTSIAPLLASSKGEALITLASSVSGFLNLWLLRWDGVSAWFPVSPITPPVIQLFPQQGPAPVEPMRRPDPALAGKNRFTFKIESPGYYLMFAPTARAADITEVQLNELYPLSGSFSSGSQVRGAVPRYVNPVAANNTGVHAAVAANAVNTFPGPIGSIESWGRTLQVVFAASWDGGNVIVSSTDQFGHAFEETFVSAPGTTVQGEKVHRVVTGIRKTAVGATANTASVGIGPGIGVPFSFTRGQEFVDGVAELATLGATYYAFTPATAANGAHDYDFIGW